MRKNVILIFLKPDEWSAIKYWMNKKNGSVQCLAYDIFRLWRDYTDSYTGSNHKKLHSLHRRLCNQWMDQLIYHVEDAYVWYWNWELLMDLTHIEVCAVQLHIYWKINIFGLCGSIGNINSKHYYSFCGT